MKHICLIDGSGYIFRAYYALPPMTSADGTPVNAVFGFSNMLMKLITDMQADHAVVVFDAARKNFRNDIYPDYKGTRKDTPEDLVPQFPIIREAAEAFNIAHIEMEGFEADDLIATYAKKARAQGAKVTVVSGDKDLMQLVEDEVLLYDPMKSKMMTRDEVLKKFGVAPDKVIDVQSLAGDSSDNVPGVPGIGVKTAALLINEYGSLENLLENADQIKQKKRRENLIEFAEQARISKQLVTLATDAPVTWDMADFCVRQAEPETVREFVKKYNFKSLVSRTENWLVKNGADGEGEQAASMAAIVAPDKTEYSLVTDTATLDKWIAQATEKGIVAIDTETTGLDPMAAAMVGFSMCVEAGKACYVPVRHSTQTAQGSFDLGLDPAGDSKAKDQPKQIALKEALKRLRPLLENPAVLKVGQNIKYDIHIFKNEMGEDLTVAPVDDTMVLSYVLDGRAHGHGMDELAKLHLDIETIKYSDVCGTGRKQIPFAEVGLDKACDYAAEDADITLRLHALFKQSLVAERLITVYEQLDRPCVQVLGNMERNGIHVDTGLLEHLSADFASHIAELEKQVYKLAGEEFNIGSPKQLGEILFDKLGLESTKKSGKTGAKSTGAGVLEALAPNHDIAQKVLDWRGYSKLKSTYTDALAKQINKKTGRVHTNFGQTITSTGRLSSNDPNLQNIPIRTEDGRKIRQAFIAGKGHKLLAADYSQVELRLVADVAEVPALKKAFIDGQDIHAATASEVFGIPIEGMDPMVRRKAKAINFGIIYGISAFGLAAQLGIERGEANDYIEAYFARFPEIRDYMEKVKDEARKYGYVVTPFGRRCYTPGINDKNYNRRSFAERAAINAPIQGGAADIIKRAMIAMPNALENAGLKARMLLQVHDELVFEVAEDQTDALQKLVVDVMGDAAKLSVPLVVDCGIGDNWAEAH